MITTPAWAQSMVYVLIDPQTGARRYVGSHAGTSLLRIKAHAQAQQILRDEEGANRAKGTWLRSLPKRSGSLPYDFEILQWCQSRNGAADAEDFWIQKLRSAGSPLLNLATGGRSPNLGRRFDSSVRLRMSAGQTRRWTDPEKRRRCAAAHVGFRASEKTKIKMARAQNLRRAVERENRLKMIDGIPDRLRRDYE